MKYPRLRCSPHSVLGRTGNAEWPSWCVAEGSAGSRAAAARSVSSRGTVRRKLRGRQHCFLNMREVPWGKGTVAPCSLAGKDLEELSLRKILLTRWGSLSLRRHGFMEAQNCEESIQVGSNSGGELQQWHPCFTEPLQDYLVPGNSANLRVQN